MVVTKRPGSLFVCVMVAQWSDISHYLVASVLVAQWFDISHILVVYWLPCGHSLVVSENATSCFLVVTTLLRVYRMTL